MSHLLVSGYIGNFKGELEDVKKRWEDFGLLEGIEEENKIDLAYMFEVMAYYLINGHKQDTFGRRDLITEKLKAPIEKYDGFENGRFETVIFPIIRRLYCGYFVKIPYRIFDVFHVAECFRDTVGTLNEEDWHKIEEMHYYRIDAEAEYTAWFCDYYESLIRHNWVSRKLLIESKTSFLNFMKESNDRIRKLREQKRLWENENAI